MLGTLTAIGGVNKAIGDPIGSIGSNIGGKIIGGIGGAIGSIFGNGRKEKRKKREQFRNALKGAGVSWDAIKKWHSDDHSAGAALVSIVNEGKQAGVNFINQNLRGKITSSKTRALLQEFRSWQKNKQNSSTSSPGNGQGPKAQGQPFPIAKVGATLGALYGAKKLFLD